MKPDHIRSLKTRPTVSALRAYSSHKPMTGRSSARATHDSLQGFISWHTYTRHMRPCNNYWYRPLAVECRCILTYRLTIARFESLVYIRISIVSILGSLNDIESLALSPAPDFEYFASKAFITSSWLAGRNSLDILNLLLHYAVRLIQIPVCSVEYLHV